MLGFSTNFPVCLSNTYLESSILRCFGAPRLNILVLTNQTRHCATVYSQDSIRSGFSVKHQIIITFSKTEIHSEMYVTYLCTQNTPNVFKSSVDPIVRYNYDSISTVLRPDSNPPESWLFTRARGRLGCVQRISLSVPIGTEGMREHNTGANIISGTQRSVSPRPLLPLFPSSVVRLHFVGQPAGNVVVSASLCSLSLPQHTSTYVRVPVYSNAGQVPPSSSCRGSLVFFFAVEAQQYMFFVYTQRRPRPPKGVREGSS